MIVSFEEFPSVLRIVDLEYVHYLWIILQVPFGIHQNNMCLTVLNGSRVLESVPGRPTATYAHLPRPLDEHCIVTTGGGVSVAPPYQNNMHYLKQPPLSWGVLSQYPYSTAI